MPVTYGFDPEDRSPLLGQFSIRLKPETPPDIRYNCFVDVPDDGSSFLNWARDTIVITPTRLRDPDVSASTLRSSAVYSGMVEAAECGAMTEPWTVSGCHIAGWLGNGANPPIGPSSFSSAGTTTLASFLVALFASPQYVGGLTIYSAATVSGNTISDDADGHTTARELIQRWCRQTTDPTEWWVRPDGGCHFAVEGNAAIFTQTPTVILGANMTPGIHAGYACFPATFRKRRDTRDWATTVANEYAAGFYSGTGNTTLSRYGFDGTTAMGQASDIYNMAFYTGKGAAALFDSVHNIFTAYFDEYTVTVSAECLPSHAKPGDYVYIYDPDTYTYNKTNEVIVNGRIIYPEEARINEMTFPITPGMGVYRIANCSADPSANYVHDLSDWVMYEDGDTRVSLGKPRPSLKKQLHPFGKSDPYSPSWR